MLPASNAEAVGEADKMTAWNNITLKINDMRTRVFYVIRNDPPKSRWVYDFFLQIGYGALIIEYYAIQGMHDLPDGFIQTRPY